MLCQCCTEAFLEQSLCSDSYWCPYCGFVISGLEMEQRRPRKSPEEIRQGLVEHIAAHEKFLSSDRFADYDHGFDAIRYALMTDGVPNDVKFTPKKMYAKLEIDSSILEASKDDSFLESVQRAMKKANRFT